MQREQNFSLWIKHDNCAPYFQMYLMGHLKALGIPMWNMGTDIKIHEARSSARVLIDVGGQYSPQDRRVYDRAIGMIVI